MNIAARSGLLFSTLLLFTTGAAFASGYHPGLDEAFAESDDVVVARVLESWWPEPTKRPSQPTSAPVSGTLFDVRASFDVRAGVVHQMRIDRVFKGAGRKGEQIVVWERNAYGVSKNVPNLVFLVPYRPSDLESKRYSFRVPVRYRTIESVPDEGDFSLAFHAWHRLLEIGVGRRSQKKLSDSFRTILEKEDNSVLLRYVADHWPGSLSPEDRALFAGVLDREKARAPSTAAAALRLLLRNGGTLDEQTLLTLLGTAGRELRGDLLRLVTAANIAACRNLLWAWVVEDEPAVDDALFDTLARLAPEFVKARLREQDLPFWKTIPLLQKLGINGSAIGRADFPPGTLALRQHTLFGVAAWFRGDGFLALMAMQDPTRNSEWRAAFPLLAPKLADVDTPARRQLVALMRTFGVPLTRVGSVYRADLAAPTVPPPLELVLRAPGAPCHIDERCPLEIDEVGHSEAWVSLVGDVVLIRQIGNETAFSGGQVDEKRAFGPDAPRSEFVLLQPGDRRTTPTTIRFERPGRYRVSAHKGYYRDGGSVGLDAWTGEVFAVPIEIEAVE